MNLRNATMLALVAVVLGSLMTSLGIRHRTQEELLQKEEKLRQQAQQLDELNAESLRLSHQLSQVQSAPEVDHMAELLKLRAEAGALRKRTNDMAKQLTENRTSASDHARLEARTTVLKPGSVYVVSTSDSQEHALRLLKTAAGERNRYSGDARNLSWAVRQFAQEHEGQVPSTFAQAAPYHWKGELPLAGTYKERDAMAGAEDFELVYHGSLNDLTNIPMQTVALIRQRVPWPTPGAKWGRIYTMTDGRLCIVESEDNFQSWEAAHIIPPPLAGR